MERLPWLVDVAALVLAWTAAQMVLHDPHMGTALAYVPWPHVIVPAVAFALVGAADLALRVGAMRREHHSPST
jgi:predicted tellurium resistance membrane protein TerC